MSYLNRFILTMMHNLLPCFKKFSKNINKHYLFTNINNCLCHI